jgi:hypothetical protein
MDSFALRQPSLGLVGVGIRTSFGYVASGSGVALDALLGEIYPSMDRDLRKRAAIGNVSIATDYFAAGAMGAYVYQGQSGGGTVLGRARLGKEDSTHLSVRLALQGGLDPVIVRTVNQAESVQPWTSFLDRNGTSLGSDMSVPLPKKLMLSSGADFDVENERFVSTRMGLGYRHPCGCIAASAWASHRVGREGIDAWISLDLAPR